MNLQGHRGCRGLLPENTLPAFERALEIGVDTLELDCAVTKDLVVVVSHDTHLNPEITRDESGRWLADRGPAIWSLTYSELQRYDVGRIDPACGYAHRFPRQQAIDGTRIPRLADVLDLVKRSGREDVRLNVETKVSPRAPEETASPETFVASMLDVIRAAGMETRVDIESFDWRTLEIIQRSVPVIPTVYLTEERRTHSAGSLPQRVHAAGGAVWSPDYETLTRDALEEAHALGLRVIVWTVNDEAEMRRMIALGVDGIMSDYPDLLVRVARERR